MRLKTPGGPQLGAWSGVVLYRWRLLVYHCTELPFGVQTRIIALARLLRQRLEVFHRAPAAEPSAIDPVAQCLDLNTQPFNVFDSTAVRIPKVASVDVLIVEFAVVEFSIVTCRVGRDQRVLHLLAPWSVRLRSGRQSGLAL